MPYEEFKQHLRRAGLSAAQLAALLDMKPNSITNYKARGHVPRHLAVIAVMAAELVVRGVDVSHLCRDKEWRA